MPSESLVVHFDGLCEPNPNGTACAGYAVVDGPAGHKLVGQGHGMTNNVAEYEAALLALRAVYKSGHRGSVTLRGDSQLVVKQFNGQYGCHSEALQPLLAQLRKAGGFFASLCLEWVPRDQNDAADEQSRLAYVAVMGKEPPVRGPKKPASMNDEFPDVDDSESLATARALRPPAEAFTEEAFL